jgi:hypothetical protein
VKGVMIDCNLEVQKRDKDATFKLKHESGCFNPDHQCPKAIKNKAINQRL